MRRTVVIVGTTFALTFATLASLLLLSTSPADACTPPDTLTITGPARGTTNTEYIFTATVSPDNVNMPVGYRWSAGAGGYTGLWFQYSLFDTATFSWPAGGTHDVVAVALACNTEVRYTHTFTIPAAVTDVTITGPDEGITGTAYSFIATVSPVTATAPITYTWTPTPDVGQGAKIVTYTWDTVGEKSIGVEAANPKGAAVDTYTIAIRPHMWPAAYVPIVLKTYVPATIGETNDAFVREVITLTNEYRIEHGCPPLSMDERLMQAAQGHSEDMAQRDYYGHDAPDGTTLTDRLNSVGYGELYVRRTGENIAAGYISPEAVFDAWVNSSGHRDNILTCYYEDIGVGYYYLDPDPGDVRQRYYWTQDMGVEEYEGN